MVDDNYLGRTSARSARLQICASRLWLCTVHEALPNAARPRFQETQRIGQRAMLEHAFASFEREVEAIEGGVALFQLIDDSKALQVVFETAKTRVDAVQAITQRFLSRVAKGRMAQVVRQ